MKRIGYNSLAFLATLALVGLASSAFAATPTPNSIYAPDPSYTRLFNDYPQATVTLVNNYPSLVSWGYDCPFALTGWGEKGIFELSGDNGASKLLFMNLANYSYEADFTLAGTNVAHGEGGLSVAPWWNDDGGEFMANSTGEITFWGSTLPGYSFSVTNSISYVLGTPIHEKVVYLAGASEPSVSSPATVTLSIVYNGTPYTSGPLTCGAANPNDPPHGSYGELDDVKLGGQVLGGPIMPPGTGAGTLTGTFSNIVFTNLDGATPTHTTTWGAMKAMYR